MVATLITSTAPPAVLRRRPHAGLPVPVALLLLTVLPAAVAAQNAPPTSVFPMPADFAPLPGLLPGSHSAQQKRLSTLLRAFEPVQAAEVVLTGQGHEVAVQVVLKLRAGRALTAELVDSLATATLSATPGLAPLRLTILQSDGRLLYGEGQCRLPDRPVTRLTAAQGLPWALLAGLIVALVARQRLRRDPVPGPLDFLNHCSDQDLRSLLARERPEVVAVLLAYAAPSPARRLRRLVGKTSLAPAPGPVTPEALALLVSALKRTCGTVRPR